MRPWLNDPKILPFTPEILNYLRGETGFFHEIADVYPQTGLALRGADPDARAEIAPREDGGMEIAFLYGLDDNADPDDGRLYLRDGFGFDASGRFRNFTRRFGNNGSGEEALWSGRLAFFRENLARRLEASPEAERFIRGARPLLSIPEAGGGPDEPPPEEDELPEGDDPAVDFRMRSAFVNWAARRRDDEDLFAKGSLLSPPDAAERSLARVYDSLRDPSWLPAMAAAGMGGAAGTCLGWILFGRFGTAGRLAIAALDLAGQAFAYEGARAAVGIARGAAPLSGSEFRREAASVFLAFAVLRAAHFLPVLGSRAFGRFPEILGAAGRENLAEGLRHGAGLAGLWAVQRAGRSGHVDLSPLDTENAAFWELALWYGAAQVGAHLTRGLLGPRYERELAEWRLRAEWKGQGEFRRVREVEERNRSLQDEVARLRLEQDALQADRRGLQIRLEEEAGARRAEFQSHWNERESLKALQARHSQDVLRVRQETAQGVQHLKEENERLQRAEQSAVASMQRILQELDSSNVRIAQMAQAMVYPTAEEYAMRGRVNESIRKLESQLSDAWDEMEDVLQRTQQIRPSEAEPTSDVERKIALLESVLKAREVALSASQAQLEEVRAHLGFYKQENERILAQFRNSGAAFGQTIERKDREVQELREALATSGEQIQAFETTIAQMRAKLASAAEEVESVNNELQAEIRQREVLEGWLEDFKR